MITEHQRLPLGRSVTGRSHGCDVLPPPNELDAFRARRAPGWTTTVRAEMRQPMAGEDDICWGGATLQLSEAAARSGWSAWASVAGPCRPGRANTAAAACGRRGQRYWREEMRALNCRAPLASFGIWMLGPALLKFGTRGAEARTPAEDRARRDPLVPGLFRAQRRLGPGLAATRAEDRGDHFIVNGQKIWTIYADKADWIFCLVRTDSAAKKHTGISFVLFDMATPGVSTKPIALISGKSPFCETFFDNVRVRKAQPGRASRRRLGRGQVPADARARNDRRHRRARRGQAAGPAGGRAGGPGCAGPPGRPDAARANRRVRGRRGRVPAA